MQNFSFGVNALVPPAGTCMFYQLAPCSRKKPNIHELSVCKLFNCRHYILRCLCVQSRFWQPRLRTRPHIDVRQTTGQDIFGVSALFVQEPVSELCLHSLYCCIAQVYRPVICTSVS